MNRLTSNEFTIKDSFDAVTQIKNISQGLLDKGYRFISFDVASLSTNVPLKNQYYIKKRLYRKSNKHYYQEKYYEKTYKRHL